MAKPGEGAVVKLLILGSIVAVPVIWLDAFLVYATRSIAIAPAVTAMGLLLAAGLLFLSSLGR